MRLSAEQRNHFDTFGFLAFPQLLSADETQALAASFDDGFRPGAECDTLSFCLASSLLSVCPCYCACLTERPQAALLRHRGRRRVATDDAPVCRDDERLHPLLRLAGR